MGCTTKYTIYMAITTLRMTTFRTPTAKEMQKLLHKAAVYVANCAKEEDKDTRAEVVRVFNTVLNFFRTLEKENKKLRNIVKARPVYSKC